MIGGERVYNSPFTVHHLQFNPIIRMTFTLYNAIVDDLIKAGAASPYPADANEPDPRYKSYGVRAAGKAEIIKTHRAAMRTLDQADRLALAKRLIHSEYGEQQSVALHLLESISNYFTLCLLYTSPSPRDS